MSKGVKSIIINDNGEKIGEEERPINPCPQCKTNMTYVSIAWDLNFAAKALVWFGWWQCPKCKMEIGSRTNLILRKFADSNITIENAFGG